MSAGAGNRCVEEEEIKYNTASPKKAKRIYLRYLAVPEAISGYMCGKMMS
jgi:hypothetical protein